MEADEIFLPAGYYVILRAREGFRPAVGTTWSTFNANLFVGRDARFVIANLREPPDTRQTYVFIPSVSRLRTAQCRAE